MIGTTNTADYLSQQPTGGGGGMSFGVGEGIALAQFGLQIGQQIFGNRAAEQQAYNRAYSNTYNNIIGGYRAEQATKQTANIFEAKLDYTKQQITNNYLAAQASWTAEQVRLNEIYDRAAYKSESMRKMLVESMGAAAAREVYGKSAKRGAAVATLGAYGRSRAQLADQLMSENAATVLRMKRVEQQLKAQNKLAIAQTAVLPMATAFSPTPLVSAPAAGIGQAIGGVLGAGLDAFKSGYSITPSGDSFFGIEKA